MLRSQTTVLLSAHLIALILFVPLCLAQQPATDGGADSMETSADPVDVAADDDSDDLQQTLDEILAGHSIHGEAFNEGPRQSAYLMGGTGNVDFEVTTENPIVQQFFNQGIGQLHGFWYLEAERTFRHVASLDDDCAMAYWGAAMATEKNRERADGFIQQAVARIDSASAREKMYIRAMETFLRIPEEAEIETDPGQRKPSDGDGPLLNSEAKKKRAAELLKDLESIAIEYPDDLEARALIAHRIWYNARAGIPVASHIATERLIDEILAEEPLHPAHHYMIHLWDHRHPEKAIRSAARCGVSAPSIAHMWHMPGHIYSKLHRYEDAIYQQEASARVDHARMMRDRVMPDEVGNFAHNNEWLIRNLVFLGSAQKALDLAVNMTSLPRHPKYNTLSLKRGSHRYGRTRMLQVLREFQLYQRTVALCRESNLLAAVDHPQEQIEYLRVAGVAAAMTGDEQLLERLKSELQAIRDAAEQALQELAPEPELKSETFETGEDSDLPAPQEPVGEGEETEDSDPLDADRHKKENRKRIEACDNAIKAIRGHEHVAAGDFQSAADLLEETEGEDKSWVAEIRMLAGQNDAGLELLNAQVDSRPREVIPLARLAYWQHKTGDEKAIETFSNLRACSSGIEIELPIFRRLDTLAGDAGLDGDWRTKYAAPQDVGFRPALNSLGPPHWSPPEAPTWELVDAGGKTVSSEQFAGRPYMIIFFLGHGCLHCAEQIEAFSDSVKDFRESGVEIIAISSDDADGLKKSVDSFGSELPYYAFASDRSLDEFRKFRAYDDFESQPLHGTFLIDADGKIRWQDISYEPFMEKEFLLKETRRILQSAADSGKIEP